MNAQRRITSIVIAFENFVKSTEIRGSATNT